MRMHIQLIGAYQDGRDFYNEETDQLLVTYPDLVTDDWDTDGAKLARERFAQQFPQFIKRDEAP